MQIGLRIVPNLKKVRRQTNEEKTGMKYLNSIIASLNPENGYPQPSTTISLEKLCREGISHVGQPLDKYPWSCGPFRPN